MEEGNIPETYDALGLGDESDVTMADLTEACSGEDIQGACTVHLGSVLHSG